MPVTREIIAVSYDENNTITGVLAISEEDNTGPKFFTREEVIDHIDHGTARFVSGVGSKPSIRVVPKKPSDPQNPHKDRYLRSDADEELADNLGNLATCPDLRERP